MVLLATTYDNMLHAHHGASGEILWSRALPADSHATPMGFRHEDMDYIVVTAGGGLAESPQPGSARGHSSHADRGRGDFVVAYRAAAGEIDDRSAPVSARLP